MRPSKSLNRRLTLLAACLLAMVMMVMLPAGLGLIGREGGNVVEAASSSYAASQGYFPAGPVAEGWPAQAVLIYSGYYASGRTGLTSLHGGSDGGVVRDDDGDWLPVDFRPYVTHLNADGEPDDTFFDTFIFLGISSARGRDFAGEYDQSRASLWWDWQWFIDRLYAPGKQLRALESAVASAASSLGKPDLTVNVYIMIPYPSYKVTDFGTIDGQTGGPSLLPVENRLAAIRWYVDEVIERWQAWQPQRLRLAGFYWMQEHVNPAVPGEETMVRAAAEYVHKLGYKLGWIPWSGAYLATSWRNYDFDWAVIQPNHMMQSKPGLIESAVQKARGAHMGVEIELDGRVKQPEGARKLYDYLDGGVRHGYMKNALIAYYQDVAMLAQLHAAGGTQRQMYDDVYAFAKGTYPQPTPAAEWISGVVVDEAGAPVAGARVQAQEAVTFTDDQGRFSLPGIYRRQINVLISRAGDGESGKSSEAGKPGVLVWPYVSPRVRGAVSADSGAGADTGSSVADLLQLVLQPERDERVIRLLGFENAEDAEGILALGWTVRRVDTQRTQGEYALELTPRSTGLASLTSLSWSTGSTAASDWTGYAAFAFDVLALGEAAPESSTPVTATFLVTLLDEEGGRYARLYSVPVVRGAGAGKSDAGAATGSAQGWQTLVVPLAAADSGAEHVDVFGHGEPGGIDPSAIVRVSFALQSVSWDKIAAGQSAPKGEPPAPARIYIDNLRLVR